MPDIAAEKVESVSKQVWRIARIAARKYSDTEKAKAQVRAQLTVLMRKDDNVRKEVLELALDELVARSCYDGRKSINDAIYRDPNPSTQTNEILDYQAERKMQGYLRGWLTPNGKVLGECTGSDLLEFVEYSEAQAQGIMWNAHFYKAIAGRVGHDELVADKFKENEIVKIAAAIK